MDILDKIPMMNDEKLLKLFLNANRQINSNPKALDVITAVQAEWRIRLEKAKVGEYKAQMPAKGMLSTFGYCVGSSGIADKNIRQQLLKTVFSSALPLVGLPAYTAEWGEPSSKDRYLKMRRSIMGFISNNSYPNMEQAKEHWLADLEYVDNEIKRLITV